MLSSSLQLAGYDIGQQQHQFYLIVITEISVELIQGDIINIYFIITKCKQFCS